MSARVISLFSRGGLIGEEKRPRYQPISSSAQMPLQLEAEHCALVFALDDVNGRDFLKQIRELQPTYIADLRSFRHFNLTGVGAFAARSALSACGAKYVYEEISYDDFEESALKYEVIKSHCKKVIHSLGGKVNQLKGPMFILVHHQHHARIVSEHLKETLAPSKKWWICSFDVEE